MKYVRLQDLKKGQVVVVGTFGVGKFELAEVETNKISFTNWDKIDMKKGSMVEDRDGHILYDEGDGGMMVLSPSEIKKANKIKDKIKMLEELKK